MPEWLYETSGPNGLWVFLVLTVMLGGAAAWVSGQAIATTWRPFWQLPIYVLLLALGVRFLHFALFEEPLLAPGNLGVDIAVLMIAAVLGNRSARAQSMITQYNWLFEASGRLGWRRRTMSEYPQVPRDSE